MASISNSVKYRILNTACTMIKKFIKDVMSELGITQKELAIGTGIPEATISRNLSCKTKMTVDNLELILTYLESKKK